jgi:hypothetical protein
MLTIPKSMPTVVVPFFALSSGDVTSTSWVMLISDRVLTRVVLPALKGPTITTLTLFIRCWAKALPP